METNETQATLYRKIAKVMGSIQRIPKRGHHDHFNYDYVLDTDVLDAVRAAMAEQELAFFIDVTECTQEQVQKYTATRVQLQLTFADGETGACHTVQWYGEARDSQDKGLNKAITAGVKYALLKTFLIATGEDDPDGSDGDDSGNAKRTSRTRRTIAQQQTQENPQQDGNGGKSAKKKVPRPLDPEKLKEILAKKIAKRPSVHQAAVATPSQKGLLAGKLEECFAGDEDATDKRHAVQEFLVGKASTQGVTAAQASALLDWLLDPNSDEGTYDLDQDAAKEAQAVYRAVVKAAGQQEIGI